MEMRLQVYTNNMFGSVRTTTINGIPYFVGKDVAKILEYGNPRDALARHVDDEDKGVVKTDTLGGTQELTVINESGLYSLILRSKKPAAREFKRWVTSEVLPSIRRYGMYATDELITNPELAISVFTALKEEREKRLSLEGTVAVQCQQIAEMMPKATYYDVVLSCQDAVNISVIAKDYGWSAKQMNEYLHYRGVQFKQGNIWLLYQHHANQGYTKTHTHTYKDTRGKEHAKVHTKWTQKGRLFIYELLKLEGIYPFIEMEDAYK